MIELSNIVREVGLPVGLVIFFVWIGWEREKKLGNRLNVVETFIQTKLIQISNDATSALAGNSTALVANTAATHQMTLVMVDLIRALQDRPCLLTVDAIKEYKESLERASKIAGGAK